MYRRLNRSFGSADFQQFLLQFPLAESSKTKIFYIPNSQWAENL